MIFGNLEMMLHFRQSSRGGDRFGVCLDAPGASWTCVVVTGQSQDGAAKFNKL